MQAKPVNWQENNLRLLILRWNIPYKTQHDEQTKKKLLALHGPKDDFEM